MRLLSRRAVATALAAAVSIAQPTKLPCSAAAAPSYPLGLTSAGSLRNCPPLSATESGCITSMPASSPNRYLPPMRYDGEKLGRDGAYKRVRAYFGADADAMLDPEAATADYMHYVLIEGSGDVADLELRFLPDDPLIAFRLLARGRCRVKQMMRVRRNYPYRMLCSTRRPSLRAQIRADRACEFRMDNLKRYRVVRRPPF